MRKRSLATLVALLAAFFAPPLASVARAQTLPVILQQTVTLPGPNTSQNLSITMTAGVTYYIVVGPYLPGGTTMQNDSMVYLYNSSGTQIGFDDDWGSYSNQWNVSQLGPQPTNGWSSFLPYTATTSGTYTIKVTTYPWGVQPVPFPVTVYGTSAGPTPPTPVPTTGIPNVRLELRPSRFDLLVSPVIQENRFPLV
jgi:hypothetical protein